MNSALQSLLDQSFLVSGYLSGKYHALFIMWSFHIMLHHLFSHHMSYAPILTHLRTNSLPMMTLSLCPWWFIRSHDPLHFLNNLTNCSHPPSCLCSLLLFYLWVAHLWSFCHGHSFVLKLYWVVWLELPSFVTSGYPHPSAIFVLKVKTSDYSEYPLRHIRSPPTLGHWGNSKAYLE